MPPVEPLRDACARCEQLALTAADAEAAHMALLARALGAVDWRAFAARLELRERECKRGRESALFMPALPRCSSVFFAPPCLPACLAKPLCDCS